MINTPYQAQGFYNPAAPIMGQGVVPNQAQMPKTGNWLSADKYALLQKGLSQFKLSVTEEELARGQCNHYNLNGTSALIPDADGSGGCTCSICGTHFNTTDYTQDDVANATQNILDILNTIKIMYLSLDPNAALEYFQIIPFIEKVPQLYNIAVNDFKKYEGVNQFVNPAPQNPFNLFSMMTNPMSFAPQGYGYPQQPMMQPMGYAPQAPVAPAPQQAPQAAPMGYNPIYGGMPTYGYPQQPMGYVNTNMPNAMNPTNSQPAQTTEQVKIDTEFKK